MLYRPLDSFSQTLRLLFQKRVRDGQLAYLGDGLGRVEVPDRRGYVYARLPAGRDSSGFAKFTSPFIVRSSGAAFHNYEGAGVYVAIGYNGELEIVSAHYAELDRTGVDTRTLNPLHQQSKWVYLWQLTIALASAVATTTNTSFLVTVKKFRHYTGNVFQTFGTDLQADKIDLSSFVPAVDMHCYAAVWIDTYANVSEVVASTAQSLFTPLDATDVQECVDNAPGRPPDAVALKLFYLANNQGTITQQAASDVDVRQFLNMPTVWGFPTTLTTRERVRPGYTLVTGAVTPSGNGALTVETGGKVIVVPDAPMEDFTLSGDTGDTLTVEDGDALTVVGTGGVSVDVDDATSTITIDGGGGGSGTVTSVGLTMPPGYSVANTPVTTAGTLAVTGTPLVCRVLSADMTIPDTYCLVVADYYRVTAGVTLTLSGDATLKII